MVKYFEQSYRVSERHACCVLELARATYRYEGHQEQWIELRMRIREIAQTRVRYGYRMIRVLLNREGWKVGWIVGSMRCRVKLVPLQGSQHSFHFISY
jgi:putative transposase